jgi:hypothetical protein
VNKYPSFSSSQFLLGRKGRAHERDPGGRSKMAEEHHFAVFFKKVRPPTYAALIRKNIILTPNSAFYTPPFFKTLFKYRMKCTLPITMCVTNENRLTKSDTGSSE